MALNLSLQKWAAVRQWLAVISALTGKARLHGSVIYGIPTTAYIAADNRL